MHKFDKFSVAPDPVNASSMKVSTTNDDIKLTWEVCYSHYQILKIHLYYRHQK